MMFRGLLHGAAAGAAGTTALDAVTYLDMALRGRPSSQTPQQAVDKLAEGIGIPVPGTGDTRDNRRSGLGSLTGIATGVGIGVLAGLLRPVLLRLPSPLGVLLIGGGAMAASDFSLAKLGVSEPATWSPADWLSDVVPHLAYGAVTYAALAALRDRA